MLQFTSCRRCRLRRSSPRSFTFMCEMQAPPLSPFTVNHQTARRSLHTRHLQAPRDLRASSERPAAGCVPAACWLCCCRPLALCLLSLPLLKAYVSNTFFFSHSTLPEGKSFDSCRPQLLSGVPLLKKRGELHHMFLVAADTISRQISKNLVINKNDCMHLIHQMPKTSGTRCFANIRIKLHDEVVNRKQN